MAPLPFKLGTNADTDTYATIVGFSWPSGQGPDTVDRQTPKVNVKTQVPYSDRWIIFQQGTSPMQLAIQGTIWQSKDIKAFYAQATYSLIDPSTFTTINNPQRLYEPRGGVEYIAITNGGSGYGAPPDVIFDNTGTGGSGAAATAILSGGIVTQILITEPGTGYTSAPTITFSAGAAAATATIHRFYKVINGSVKEDLFGANPLGFPYVANFDLIDPFVYSDIEVKSPDNTGWSGAAPLTAKSSNYNNGNAYVYPRFEIQNNNGSPITKLTITSGSNVLTWTGSLANGATLKIYQDYLGPQNGPDITSLINGVISGSVSSTASNPCILVATGAKATVAFDTPNEAGATITAWIYMRDRNW